MVGGSMNDAHRIVLADQRSERRQLLSWLLHQGGFEVVEADDLGGIARACADDPDLVIMSTRLMGDGIAACRELKSSPATSSVLVLLLAPPADDVGKAESLDAGADGYLALPVERTEFLASVRALARLRAATRELARSNAELERFSYAASHDLREPLRMISGFLDIIKRRHADELAPKALEYLDTARDASVRLRAMLEALLRYAHAGSADWTPVTVPLETPLRDALQDLSVAIAATGAEVSVEGELPTVHGDVILLAQLLQNLVANALKYRSSEPPRVRIRAEADRERNEWLIAVADNGIGIPAEALTRIFAPFQRAVASGAGSGSGIGLATCQRIVRRHHGRIWAESEPRHGAVFKFTLPMLPQEALAK
jgi:signal transduction histidine kinase